MRLKENEFEKQLIEMLCTGTVSQKAYEGHFDFNHPYSTRLWEYRPDIKTTSQLENNFKEILEKNNAGLLDGPLSQTEFVQVMKEIEGLATPYDAARFLYGVNGNSSVQVKMDDGRDVFLTVFDQAQIGTGNTVYQVVNQIERPAVIPGKKDRRFDVTLLINGLPLVQIELKNEDLDANEALNQMEKYANEKQYTGIFSTLQILVGMTPINTKYMAMPQPGRFNKDFSFYWKDEHNKNLRHWRDFAKYVLTIPAVHLLATNYMIIDGTKGRESIKVMRPYQVSATTKVLDEIENTNFSLGLNRDGYVWHTTGSGKTITSYKTADLASKSPNVDKVIFLVDRKTLTRQTIEAYRAYDPETLDPAKDDKTNILNTKTTRDLERKLKSPDSKIIVTSTQKIRRLIKKKGFEPKDKKYVFIVDEAHRSTGSDTFEDIQKAFKRSAWIGYSGTPVFEDEKKGYRTIDIFGKLLDAYTIREAIEDRNVLGFKVEFNKTVPDEERLNHLRNYFKESNPSWSDEKIEETIQKMGPADMEGDVRKSFYDENQKHIEAVVSDIITNWENRSSNWKYNAILTTHVEGSGPSVPMALMYYQEFKKKNEIRKKYGFRELKVAISVSGDDSNSDEVNKNRANLEEAIADYNQMFHTGFNIDEMDSYNMDLEDRLAKLSDDGNYLDLVIVVDRLLTGFNAPELNTLYVDRVLKGRTLIQAYSRTNRIHNMQDKPFGNIVNYRWPDYAEQMMNEALAIYSNRNSADLTPEEQKELNIIENIIQGSYSDQIARTKKIIEEIRKYTGDFDLVPDDPNKQDLLLQAMRQYSRGIAKLKQYPCKTLEDGTTEGFDYKNPDQLFEDLGLTEHQGETIQTTLYNELKRKIAERKKIDPSLVDLVVERIKEVQVDYDYLTKLFEDLMNEVHDKKMEKAAKTKESIVEFANGMDDRTYAKQITRAAEEIYEENYNPEDFGLVYPYHLNNTKVLMENIQNAQEVFYDRKLLDFKNKWGITEVITNKDLQALLENHEYGKDDFNLEEINDILVNGSKQYKQMAYDETVKRMQKIKYRNALRQAIMDLADEILREG